MEENFTPGKESYHEIVLQNSNRSSDNSIKPKDIKSLPVQAINFEDDSYSLECPFCNQTCITRTVKKKSKFLYISFGILMILPPLCLVPCFLSSCYDKYHYCDKCNSKIGCHKTFGRTSKFDKSVVN
jgi:hypothetical protein